MEAVQIIDGRIGITREWLVVQGVASAGACEKSEQRQRIVALTRGGRGVAKVYEYKTLPEDLRRKVDARIDVYATARKSVLDPYIEHNAEASRYYDDYTTRKGSHLPNSKENPIRQTYYTNAVLIEALLRWEKALHLRGQRMDWAKAAEAVRTIDRLDYPSSLPENDRKLRDKVRQYEREGYECLIHKNYRRTNTNAAKIHEGEQADLLIALIAQHRNFDCEQIAKLYNAQCTMHNTQAAQGTPEWKPITASTVRQWQKKKRFLTTASKHGAATFRNTMTYQVKRKAPETAMALWVLDGWDAELLYQSKRGNRTTYYNRLTVEVILDAATKYPIGWAVGETESAALIREALRNAERHTEELTGCMLMPHQIQCDNFARKAMMETYTGLAQYVTPAAVGNAKAKIIEPWFRTLNDKYCKFMPNWSGHGVTAHKDGQPNLDITLKQKHLLPTIDEIIVEVAALMDIYRREALPAYQGAIDALPAEQRRLLNPKQYLCLFGESTGQTYTLQGTGINVRIDGKPHPYDLMADPEDPKAMAEAIRFREQCWEKWSVLRDPLDTKHIVVENKQRTEQYLLTLKDEQPMALIDRKPGDYEKLAAIWKFNKALEAHVASTLSGHQKRAMTIVKEITPGQTAIEQRNYEMLSKALICDSQGQHKDERYKAERGDSPNSVRALKDRAKEITIEDIDPFKAAPTTEKEEMWDDL